MSRSAKPQNGRRRFLRDVVRTAGGLAAVGVALGLQQQTARASGVRLRPPGAINENAFASACVRCVQCVQACPYDTLKLATLASGLSAGTPYFVARDIPCEMCEDIPCAKVCPSGALDREIESIDDARMGLAVLVDQENCLNFQGLRCATRASRRCWTRSWPTCRRPRRSRTARCAAWCSPSRPTGPWDARRMCGCSRGALATGRR